jgi:hypothetical protein
MAALCGCGTRGCRHARRRRTALAELTSPALWACGLPLPGRRAASTVCSRPSVSCSPRCGLSLCCLGPGLLSAVSLFLATATAGALPNKCSATEVRRGSLCVRTPPTIRSRTHARVGGSPPPHGRPKSCPDGRGAWIKGCWSLRRALRTTACGRFPSTPADTPSLALTRPVGAFARASARGVFRFRATAAPSATGGRHDAQK